MFIDLVKYYTVPVIKRKWHSIIFWSIFGAMFVYFGKFPPIAAVWIFIVYAISSIGISVMYFIADDNYTRRLEFYHALKIKFRVYFLILVISSAILTIVMTLVPLLILMTLIYNIAFLKILFAYTLSNGIWIIFSCIISALIGIVIALWRPSFSFIEGIGTAIILALCIIPFVIVYSLNIKCYEILYVPPLTPLTVTNISLKILSTILETVILYYIAYVKYNTFFYTTKPTI